VSNNYFLERFIQYGMCFFIIFYQFIPIINFILPEIRVLGKNFYVILPGFYLVVSYVLLIAMKKINTRYVAFSSIIFIFYLIATFVASLLYHYELVEYLNRRFMLIPTLMFMVIFYLLGSDKAFKELILKLFLLSVFIQCSLGYIHHIFFPEIWFISEDNVSTFSDMSASVSDVSTREIGTLISSSLFGYFLLSGIYVLLYVKALPFKLEQPIWRYAGIFYLLFGIVLSGCRGAIILAILSIVFTFVGKNNISIRGRMILLLFLVGFFVMSYEIIHSSVLERTLHEGSGGRYEKLVLAWMLLSQDLYFLVGVPSYVTAATSINGIYLSDNSFALLLVTFGMLGLFFILSILWFNYTFIKSTKTVFPALSGLVCLSVTNAILWEPWLFYYITAMALIWYSNCEPQLDRDSSSRKYVKGYYQTS